MIPYTEQKDEWYGNFMQISSDEKYEMIMEVLEQNVPDDELIEDDFGLITVEFKSDLIHDNQYEKAIHMIEKTKESTDKFYQNEFPYLSNFAVEYYLYTKDFDKLHVHLHPFIANPGHVYEMFLPLYEKIRFYQMDELMLKLAEELNEPIQDSDELIPGAESDLIDTIFFNACQEFYQTLDTQQLENTLRKYDYNTNFEPEQQFLKKIATAGDEEPIFTRNDWATVVQNNSKDKARSLFWAFAVYMFKKGNFHFSISASIWFPYFNMLARKESLSNFRLQYQDLDELIGKFFGFMSNTEEQGFALLWGIPYIYDFLRDQQLVTEEISDKALEHVATVKNDLFKVYKDDIWRFDFVHTWVKPSSVNDESFTEEKNHFHQTFLDRTMKRSSTKNGANPFLDHSVQMSLFDDLVNEGGNKQQTKSQPTKAAKSKKRKKAKQQQKKNRKK
ncbi:hypothetical protein HUG20_06905 [Salicibibacter cibi]|uniref:Uncharacterized protein n=1 Tax=Salicibibacter cibi TaxID=2743001 RepID=A0A7T7CF53_9BACI|nr:hypothetical protein [Salicibibacter cibi]QQK79634.1 hypothetical protein HUG20_06905 [Salicibibacter cibi]